MGRFVLLGCLGFLILVVLIGGLWYMGVYNNLVGLEQQVMAQTGQVQNAYQRRTDLIPNLVRTVQGAAGFEKSTLEAVTEARAKVGQVQLPPGGLANNPQAFQQYEQAQAQLGGALSRLIAVAEAYPQLKSNENFLELQAELAGTENRIAVERRKYNDVAQSYNTAAQRFPANLVARMSGFQPKPYFQATAGSDKPPEVNFNFNK